MTEVDATSKKCCDEVDGPVTKKMKVDHHKVVDTYEEWLVERKELLQKEKDLTKLRDEVTKQRQELSWMKVDPKKCTEDYVFQHVNSYDDGNGGIPTIKVPFKDLFRHPNSQSSSSSQLMVYHFMLGKDWNSTGCPSCSYIADHFNSNVMKHLQARDIRLVVVSNAPTKDLAEYQKRMGWKDNFDWYSSYGTSFNYDYHVSFTKEQLESKTTNYNYNRNSKHGMSEAPGLSVFYKPEDSNNDGGVIYHTYSTYARGLDILLGAYNFMDMCPKGRNESELPWTMVWVKRHDEYDFAKNDDGDTVDEKKTE